MFKPFIILDQTGDIRHLPIYPSPCARLCGVSFGTQEPQQTMEDSKHRRRHAADDFMRSLQDLESLMQGEEVAAGPSIQPPASQMDPLAADVPRRPQSPEKSSSEPTEFIELTPEEITNFETMVPRLRSGLPPDPDRN